MAQTSKNHRNYAIIYRTLPCDFLKTSEVITPNQNLYEPWQWEQIIGT